MDSNISMLIVCDAIWQNLSSNAVFAQGDCDETEMIILLLYTVFSHLTHLIDTDDHLIEN